MIIQKSHRLPEKISIAPVENNIPVIPRFSKLIIRLGSLNKKILTGIWFVNRLKTAVGIGKGNSPAKFAGKLIAENLDTEAYRSNNSASVGANLIIPKIRIQKTETIITQYLRMTRFYSYANRFAKPI